MRFKSFKDFIDISLSEYSLSDKRNALMDLLDYNSLSYTTLDTTNKLITATCRWPQQHSNESQRLAAGLSAESRCESARLPTKPLTPLPSKPLTPLPLATILPALPSTSPLCHLLDLSISALPFSPGPARHAFHAARRRAAQRKRVSPRGRM